MAEKKPLERFSKEARLEWQQTWLKLRSKTHQELLLTSNNEESRARSHNQSTRKEISMVLSPFQKKAMFWAAIWALVYASYAGLEMYRDWSDPRADLRDKYHAAIQLEIAKINSEKKAIEKGIPVPVVTSNATGVAYDCNSAQSALAGYHKRKLNYLSDDETTTVTGCIWLAVNQEVASISGENFIIEFPTENGSSRYYKTPSDENPDPAVFWNKISNNPQLQGRAVRVHVAKDGFVTITRKGS